jgi:hypothetical protein
MTREDIVEMAREAGFYIEHNEIYSMSTQSDHELTEPIERFAALVAAAERRNCVDTLSFHGEMSKDDDPEWSEVAFWCCSRINNPIQTDKTFAVNYKEIDNVREKV